MTEQRPVYLDYAATAPCVPAVVDAWVDAARTLTGNPSARGHLHGARAAQAVDLARERVAALVGAHPGDVVFTATTTEASHLAIRACAAGGKVVLGPHEHASVARYVEHLGGRRTVVPCDTSGLMARDALLLATDASTTLVCLLHGNNEVGALLHLEDTVAALRERYDGSIHIDAAQTARHIPIDLAALDIDTLAMSSHKIGGPTGVAALITTQRFNAATRLQTLGGGQERGLRAGTLATPAIVAFGVACDLARRQMVRDSEHVRGLASWFWETLSARLPAAVRLGPPRDEDRLPHIVTFYIPGIAARLLQAEVRESASIATGAACASTHLAPSATLTAMGVSPEAALCVVRASFGPEQTRDDIAFASRSIVDAVVRLGGQAC